MRKKMSSRITLAMTGLLLAAGTVAAQPALQPQGGSSIEMDHSRMGGSSQQDRRPAGAAPALNPQGGGNIEMDHSRMGSAPMGHPSGGQITGNAGAGGGPDVQHGPATTPRR